VVASVPVLGVAFDFVLPLLLVFVFVFGTGIACIRDRFRGPVG